MLRVLFVTRKYPPSVGGMETLAHDVVRSLDPVCDLQVVSLGRGNAHLPLWLPRAAAIVLWHTVVRRDVDRLLLGDVFLHVLLIPLLRQVRVPMVTMVMGLDVTWSPKPYQHVVRRALGQARCLVAISSATAEATRQAGAAPTAVHVLRLAVQPPEDPPPPERARSELRKILGLPKDACIVVTLGRLVERKGMVWFAEHVVPRLDEGTWYVVAGSGPDLGHLRALADRRPTSPTTLVLGPVDDAMRELLLSGADLFVQPNIPVHGDMEGFGLVTLEATLRGVPVVASALEGICDVIENCATGWLVTPGDAGAWVETVRSKVGDEGARADAARAFRDEALTRFSVPRMGRDLLELVEQAGAPDRPSPLSSYAERRLPEAIGRELVDQDSGPVRALYIGGVTAARRALDGSRLLAAWDRKAADSPRGRTAHLRTLLAVHRPEDLIEMDLAWWTYEAQDEIDSFLAGFPGGARVLEFGSGGSTVWLARRAGSVDSVEHDAGWAERVRDMLGSAPGLRCAPVVHSPAVPRSQRPLVPSGAPSGRGLDFEQYVSLPLTLGGRFDLILVDGRAREESLLRSLALLGEGGMALLDDSQRPRYQASLAQAAARGWTVRTTRGLTPCQPFPRQTTLLTRAHHPTSATG